MVATLATVATGSFDGLSAITGAVVLFCLLAAVVNLTASLRDAITLAQAAHLFSPVPHIATLHRWSSVGVMVNGVRIKLSTWRRGGVRVTTPLAVEEFLHALNSRAEQTGDSPSDIARRSREAGKALESLGC